MLILQIIILMLLLALGVVFISTLIGVPFLPTHKKQARLMMEMTEIHPGMTVIDLGSGAGRLLFLAAERGAHAIGYELNPFLYLWTKFVAIIKGRASQVEVHCQSLYGADVSKADVVFAFLFPKPMEKLAPKLFGEMKKGSTIASYVFSVPGAVPFKKKEAVMLYRV